MVTAVALSGSAAAIALSGGSSPVPAGEQPHTVQATGTPPAPNAEAAPTDVPRIALDAFEVLRRPAQPADALPQTVASRLNVVAGNASLARRVIGGPSPRWLVPASGDRICAVAADGASISCLSADLLARQGTVGSDECGPAIPVDRMVVHGIVPDGVDAVTLTSRVGSTSVPVSGNGWSATTVRVPEDERPFAVSWQAGGTTHELAVPVSPDVNQGCG
ncbi:MAG: hypothetical protein ACTHOE_14465 [Conexibacter sp.]